MKSTWRFVLKIIGLSLAAAGLICVVVGSWDKLADEAACLKRKLCGKRGCSEFSDYDDDLFYEE